MNNSGRRDHGWQRSYAKFFGVGAVVGALTVLVREGIAAILPGDSPAYYALSACLAYAIGILASYYGHRTITFRHADPVGGLTGSLGRFTAIAVLGLLVTTALSVALRYGLPLEQYLGTYEQAFAFALATVASSWLTYTLNATYTFACRSPLEHPLSEECGVQRE